MDTIPKQLNFEVDQNLDTTRNLDYKCKNVLYNYHFRAGRLRLKPDLCIDTIPKQLNYQFDPNTDDKKFIPKVLKFHVQLYSF